MGEPKLSLVNRLDEDMKTAMKQREAGKVRLSVIRMVKAAVKNAQIEKGRELGEDEVTELLAREVKMRREVIPEYEKAQRPDRVDELKAEIAVLEEYLPPQLTEAEIRNLVQEAVLKTGARSPREMGKVMAVIMPQVRGRADGKLVNRIVTEALQ